MKSVLDEDLRFDSQAKPKADSFDDDFRAPYEAWKATPTPETSSALVRAVRPVLDTAVYSYAGANASPAVKSRAKLMALDALATYDPAKGSPKTHLLSHLQGLKRYSAQQQHVISIPERVALDRRDLIQAENQLEDELGRTPSDMEIADRTGLSLKRIAYVRSARMPTAAGSLRDETGEVFSPASSLPGGGDPNLDSAIEMVYYDLGDTDRLILDLTLGLRGAQPHSNQEIAKRLNIQPSAVSQRKAKIQALIDEMAGFSGG